MLSIRFATLRINGASFGFESRIGGRGCRCHRIQGESKYYEQFILFISYCHGPSQARAPNHHWHFPSHMRYDYSDKSLRGDIHTVSYGPIGGEESSTKKLPGNSAIINVLLLHESERRLLEWYVLGDHVYA